jgi:hypothetical protein
MDLLERLLVEVAGENSRLEICQALWDARERPYFPRPVVRLADGGGEIRTNRQKPCPDVSAWSTVTLTASTSPWNTSATRRIAPWDRETAATADPPR